MENRTHSFNTYDKNQCHNQASDNASAPLISFSLSDPGSVEVLRLGLVLPDQLANWFALIQQ